MTTREIVLDGGSPWGFRLHGGADVHQPLRISRVNPGSKAALRGVREGNFITSINSQSTKDLTNSEAHNLLKNSGGILRLGLNEEFHGSPKKRQYRTTIHQETHSETIQKSSVTYTKSESNDPKTSTPTNGSAPGRVNSSTPSTPSSYTDFSGDLKKNMADKVSSRSRRKRSRNRRKNITKLEPMEALEEVPQVHIEYVSDEEPAVKTTTSSVHIEEVTDESDASLRSFLGGLPLVTSPDDGRERRAKKRALLSQYFGQVFENPRYLDVITEENEFKVETKVMPGGCYTPDVEVVFLEEDSSPENSVADGLIQLTPPPTPDEVITSRSPSSSRSDSASTIIHLSCTAEPPTLRELCVKCLQELTAVASSVQSLTQITQTVSPILETNSFDVTVNPMEGGNSPKYLPFTEAKNLADIDAQMRILREKERQIETELALLQEEKRKLSASDFFISPRGDFAEIRPRPVSMPCELFREQMFEEYLSKIAAREERKHQNYIKITPSQRQEVKPLQGLEEEFMEIVRRKQIMGKLTTETEDRGGGEDDTLPKHLLEFVEMHKEGVCRKKCCKEARRVSNVLSKNRSRQVSFLHEIDAALTLAKGFLTKRGVWSPCQKQEFQPPEPKRQEETNDEPVSQVWTPKSANSSPGVDRKEFRPVKFESPVLSRKNKPQFQDSEEPPWKLPESSSDTGIALSSALQQKIPTSYSSPGFDNFATRLPKVQNPTITLLQKAREGNLPKGAIYIDQEQSHRRPDPKPSFVGPGEILYKIKNDYVSESDNDTPRRMVDLGPRKFEGIGPTTKDGMPLILRSEVKDANQSKWYKKMYDTIHKQRPHRDEYVTVKYKQRRGQYPYTSGYLSEPEPGAYDSDYTDYKYATLDRRRYKENEYPTMPRPSEKDLVKHGADPYKNQPGRIENYIPGRSSVSEKEAKEWWDEVMDIFDGHLEQQKRVPQTKSFINQAALKESGYESDSLLVFRRKDEKSLLSPTEQKEAYKIIQKGGDIPLHGLRKAAPERPKEPEPPLPPPKGYHGLRSLQPESPRKYLENEVTIHYKTPVRQEIKEYLSEDELAYRQAEAMKKIYQDERRRKHLQVSKSLQELQDITNRRHTDNFIPSQKSPIPLNRYDDFEADLPQPGAVHQVSLEPRLLARALYNFVGQTSRELTFRKGDLIHVRRQVDKNWYEGELNAMVGLFPVNYIEIVTYDATKTTPRKSHEGQARARYNFIAQTNLELSLAKGELVILTRRVDDNWFEGKIGGRKGIFPVSYVEVLIDPSEAVVLSTKPIAAPAAHSLLLNGTAGGKESMGSHSYTPTVAAKTEFTTGYRAKVGRAGDSYGSVPKSKSPMGQALHIETQAEPIPYRALYKYLPQNDDELELLEGDAVFVLEKCDDGWFVGSSERTGVFGTFPGNYVERI